MFAVLLLTFLMNLQDVPQTTHFRPFKKSLVPWVLIVSEPLCQEAEPSACRRRFRDVGRAWTGDVNGDGIDELLIQPGTGGTGAGDMLLFQKFGDLWRPILEIYPDWERLAILAIDRGGYHDLHLDYLHCYKWSGQKYVHYVETDYRRLRAEFFATSNPDNASILWMAEYAGLKEFQFEPRWFSFTPEPTDLTEPLVDREQNLTWVAEFKGGVWGVQGNRSFLILPRPRYKGSERLELKGDWPIIYGDRVGMGDEKPIARYNRRTQQLVIDTKEPYWLLKD